MRDYFCCAPKMRGFFPFLLLYRDGVGVFLPFPAYANFFNRIAGDGRLLSFSIITSRFRRVTAPLSLFFFFPLLRGIFLSVDEKTGTFPPCATGWTHFAVRNFFLQMDSPSKDSSAITLDGDFFSFSHWNSKLPVLPSPEWQCAI